MTVFEWGRHRRCQGKKAETSLLFRDRGSVWQEVERLSIVEVDQEAERSSSEVGKMKPGSCTSSGLRPHRLLEDKIGCRDSQWFTRENEKLCRRLIFSMGDGVKRGVGKTTKL